MKLQSVSLRGRRFFIQFYEIMHEFGQIIPWLDDLDEMRFATNGDWFCDELRRRLGQGNGMIVPYQFVDENRSRAFVGGILHFDQHPEKLRDTRNAETVERLQAEGFSYISCLQVREKRRGDGSGTEMMRRAISAILNRHGSVWGIVSDPCLIPWYKALNAQLLSPLDNSDKLWIVSWHTSSQITS